MIYSIGTNFSETLIENISEMDLEHKIKTVFGKLQEDIIGGGRAAALLPKINISQLEEYIKLCHSKNIGFNYLLNPMCLSNSEIEPNKHNEILSYIDSLVGIGVDGFTVNSPYLCRVLRNRYPDIKITIGLYANVCSIRQIVYWEEMNADEITLSHRVNRDFKLLESILRHTADRKIHVRVIANNVCLKDCPYRVSHGTGQSHASTSESNKVYCDLDLLSCTYKKISDPAKILSSDWIRPEDVKYYEELCEKTNNYKFSMKLVERTKNTEFLTRVAKAYINERYEGNLLDILGWPEKKEVKNIDYESILKNIQKCGYSKNDVLKYLQALKLPHIYIENNKLDGFIEKFISDNNCEYCVCGNLGSNDKGECSYCSEWSKKSIALNVGERDSWINNTKDLLNQFDSSSIFKK